MMRARCSSTVFRLIPCCAAISREVRPSAMSFSTWSSRAVSTVSGTLLGFGDSGQEVPSYRAMLDLLLLAMEHNWTVNLRVDEEISADRRTPTHLRIVTVTIANPASMPTRQ